MTGSTGFVGSRTVAHLLAHGHEPRLLVRDKDKAEVVLGRLGIDLGRVELVLGDMADREAVEELLEGCDAVIHAAAAIGVTGGASVVEQNVRGAELVLGTAVERGLDPVIHISTVAVFVPPAGPVITADSPLAAPRTDYGRSKVETERYVRALQDAGRPVTSVYPGGVVGPGQPTLDAMMEGLAGALGSVWPLPTGGACIVHVEDLAEALARLVQAGHGPRRCMLAGNYATWPELADVCDDVTGVRCRRFRVPGGVMLALGSALDGLKRIRSFDYPLTRDAAEIMVSMVPADDRPTLDAVGMEHRPLRDSIEDAVRALAADGHLVHSRAGRLAPGGIVVKRRVIPRLQSWTRRRVVPIVTRSGWFIRVGPKVVPPLDRAVRRVTRGRYNFSEITAPTITMTTIGSVSGEPRTVALACAPEADGTFLIIGSNFGREKHPAWTTNLLHHPSATVTYKGRTAACTATLLDGQAREAAWVDLMWVLPVFDAYQKASERTLRVFRLTPNE